MSLNAMILRITATGIPLNVYKNSRPIPTCTPFLLPSLLLATSGTPKLTSTRTGLNLYISPRPTEIDGRERESETIVLKEASAHSSSK